MVHAYLRAEHGPFRVLFVSSKSAVVSPQKSSGYAADVVVELYPTCIESRVEEAKVERLKIAMGCPFAGMDPISTVLSGLQIATKTAAHY